MFGRSPQFILMVRMIISVAPARPCKRHKPGLETRLLIWVTAQLKACHVLTVQLTTMVRMQWMTSSICHRGAIAQQNVLLADCSSLVCSHCSKHLRGWISESWFVPTWQQGKSKAQNKRQLTWEMLSRRQDKPTLKSWTREKWGFVGRNGLPGLSRGSFQKVLQKSWTLAWLRKK